MVPHEAQKEDIAGIIEKADLPITSVVVYRQGAGIKRSGTITLADNTCSEIRLQNLPLILDDSSVRVQVLGQNLQSLVTVRGINILLELPDELDVPTSPEIERLKDLQYEQSLFEIEASRLQDLINKYKNINFQAVEIEEEHIPTPLKARLKLHDIIVSQIKKMTSERSALAIKLQTVKREIIEIEGNRVRLSNARERREKEIKKSVIIDLDIKEIDTAVHNEIQLDIVLEYLIPGARWTPVYTLNFIKNFSRTIVSHRGMVAQKSGEDWSGAAITLSTASTGSWTEIPELKAKIIGRQKPSGHKKGWREPPVDWMALYNDFDNFNARLEIAKSSQGEIFGGVSELNCIAEIEDEYDDESEEDFGDKDYESAEYSKSMAVEEVVSSPQRKERLSSTNFKKKASGIPKSAPAMEMARSLASPPILKAPSEEFDYSNPANLQDWSFYRLPDYSNNKRNNLQVYSPVEKYMEMIIQNGLHLSYDVVDLISQSIREAHSVFDLPLPVDCTNPGSIEGYDYTYDSIGTVDIPSDGQFHMVPLAMFETDSVVKFISVPREDPLVFRTVSFCNNTDAPVLHGPCEVSIDGQYLLSSNLQETAKSAFIDLGLGVDEGIKIARNVIFEEKTSGLLSANLGLYHKITISITNNLSYSVPLEIQERIPVPDKKNEKTKVEFLKSEPVCEKFTDKHRQLEGGYCWSVQLKPGESKELLLEYSIEIPNNYEIIDGNRREN